MQSKFSIVVKPSDTVYQVRLKIRVGKKIIISILVLVKLKI